MRVYKDFYDNDIYDLLSKASENGHLSSDLVNYEVSRLLYDFMEMSSNEETTEDQIYDFIRFEMEIQTEEEIRENYEEAKESEDIEDFLSYHTAYIGNYEEDNETIHIFLGF
jgi:hypothetical protein